MIADAAATLERKLPAVCDVSVTNVCNAACDFCGFSRDKTLAGPRRYIDPAAFARALPILHRRGIRHLTFQGANLCSIPISSASFRMRPPQACIVL